MRKTRDMIIYVVINILIHGLHKSHAKKNVGNRWEVVFTTNVLFHNEQFNETA